MAILQRNFLTGGTTAKEMDKGGDSNKRVEYTVTKRGWKSGMKGNIDLEKGKNKTKLSYL